MSFRIKRPVYSLALTHGASANTVSTTAQLNGILRQVIVTPPTAVDGSATLTVNLIDADSNTVWTKASIAAGSTHSITLLTNDLRVPLAGSYTVQVVFSANQTATDTMTKVALLIET